MFFSWQSDRPNRGGRTLIENALKDAISRVTEDVEVEEALRQGLTLDKDTMGVSGSPPIFATILEKIDRATIYVLDFTFVGKNSTGEPIPNPNVLIEYGWALKSLGHKRIVAVMNEAYGAPTRESLPFDLALMRFPITYNVPENAPASLRQEERKKLSEKLENALRGVFESSDYKESLPKKPQPALFKCKDPMEGRARFRRKGERIGVYVDPISAIVGKRETRDVYLSGTPATWLRLMPVADPGRKWLLQSLQAQATPLAILPLMPSAGGIYSVHESDGCGYFRTYDESQPAPGVAFVFETGELWVINASPSRTSAHIQLSEEGFTLSLTQCASFLELLGISAPYRWIVGIEGFKGRYLYIPNRLERIGLPCLADLIEEEGKYEKGDDAAVLLQSFFERVFDQCGVQRDSLRR